MSSAGALAIATVLVAAPTGPVDLHPGMGMLARMSQEARPSGSQSEAPAPPPVLPVAGLRPPTTLDVVRSSRRARIMSVTAALAVQGAMIVYGILSMREQAREARQLRDRFPTFNPYPR